MNRGVLFLVASVAVAAAGCRPETEGRPSLVDSERVLAIRSVPAEAKPDVDPEKSEVVTFEALLAGPGDADASGLQWALCEERKPLAVNAPAAAACLRPKSGSLVQMGSGAAASHAVTPKACSVFGPTQPDVEPGEPSSRPADPDTTGGYYQPVRLLVPGEGEPEYVVGVTRLDCGLAGASQEQSVEYNKRHRPNENPAIETLELKHERGGKETLSADPSAPAVGVKRGEHVTLHAGWVACPTTPVCGDGMCSPGENQSKDALSCPDDCAPQRCSGADCPADVACGDGVCSPKEDPLAGAGSDEACADDCPAPRGCTGSESYLLLDPASHTLVDRREAIRVSWFATDGDFDHDRTGRAEEEAAEASSDNEWTAPDKAGVVKMWVVLRDDRGGTGWSEVHVDVQP